MNAIIVKGLPRPRVSDPPPHAAASQHQHPFHSLTHFSSTTRFSGSPLPLARQQQHTCILPPIIEPTSTNDVSIIGLISCSIVALFSEFSKQQLIRVGNRTSVSRGSLKYSNGMVQSCCRIVGRCPVCSTACVVNRSVSIEFDGNSENSPLT